jgi:hypothetical protein
MQMAIVNYSAIIFPVSIAMSEGDVIRLNRMYKCGPLQTSEQSHQGDAIRSTQSVTGIERRKTSSPEASKSAGNEIEIVKPKKSKLFGVFIFKEIGEN